MQLFSLMFQGYLPFFYDITLLELLVYHYAKVVICSLCISFSPTSPSPSLISQMGILPIVKTLTQLLNRAEFNEATEPALRLAAIAAVRQDALRALCVEFSSHYVCV